MTPEEGMFVGPDQSERDQQVKQRNLTYKKELEQVLMRLEIGVLEYDSNTCSGFFSQLLTD